MSGLRWPVGADHPITQSFLGTANLERPGWHDDKRARRVIFTGSRYQAHLHGATDVACPIGTVAVAPESGRIVAAGIYSTTGELYLMLQVRPGTVLFMTHLSRLTAHVGDSVARGDGIALTGNSGLSTGPHLHWEVRQTSNVTADPHRSDAWYKWDPERLRVGGDLASMNFIRPL